MAEVNPDFMVRDDQRKAYRACYEAVIVPVLLIEIRPLYWGWKAFEAPGVEPVFPKKDYAIDYARNRACFRSGEIHVLDSHGNIESTIPFSEATRKL